MKKRPYTSNEVEKIKHWRKEGLLVREIAAHLNRSIGSICSICERLSITRSKSIRNYRKWNEEHFKILCSHYERGDSRKKLAEEFGVTENTISVTLTRARHLGLLASYKHIGRPRINAANH